MHRAYAKINIGLYVDARRADGFHDIETVFHRINCWDVISYAPGETIAVESTSPHAPGGPSNICHKAAVLLQNHLGTGKGVSIAIQKGIPVGAGLGGGSADAALVLKTLPAFWGVSVDAGTLVRLALQLGSDVPFFLADGSAVGRGRGEKLEYFRLDIPWAILVCTPPVQVSTAWAYGALGPRPEGRVRDVKTMVLQGMDDPRKYAGILRNDFEDAVFSEYPVTREVKETMLREGALWALLSGSGSSVFGFFRSEEEARSTGEAFARQSCAVSVTPPHFAPGGSA